MFAALFFLYHLCDVQADRSPYDNTYREDFAYYATKVRADKLNGYDKVVPPWSKRSSIDSKAGAQIGLQVRFFKVQAVDASSGLMNLKVWVRMTWTDLRLSWNASEYGNVTQVHYLAAHWTAAEITEIWLPDLQLYNADEGTVLTLEPSGAIVQSDGSIFWTRPGMLKTMCRFSGLVAFPYDRMKCAMEWGGWIFSGDYQGMKLMGDTPGYEFSSQEATAGSSYQEYKIDSVEVELNQVYYACCPQESWPLAKYVITLGRAEFYYSLLIIIPTILITMLSFGVFFMSHEVGERLSFGITLVLVIEVMKVTVATFVPVCGELLWVDAFMWICTFFCLVSLLETMVVLFLAFHADEELLPDWLSWLRPSFYRGKTEDSETDTTSCAGEIYKELNSSSTGEAYPIPLDLDDEASETDCTKLIYYEKLFCELDPDCRGSVALSEVAKFMTFVNLRMAMEECIQKLSLFDKTPGQRNFGRLSRHEFVNFCSQVLWYIPIDDIRVGSENYITVYNQKRTLLTSKWKNLSKDVDRWSRFWFPFLFIAALGVMANLEFNDPYMDKDAEMFQGVGEISISSLGIARVLVTPSLGIVCLFAWYNMQHVGTRKKQQVYEKSTERFFRGASVMNLVRSYSLSQSPSKSKSSSKDTSPRDSEAREALFHIGERVEFKRKGKWEEGIVTSTVPLRVRLPSRPSSEGYVYDAVRKRVAQANCVALLEIPDKHKSDTSSTNVQGFAHHDFTHDELGPFVHFVQSHVSSRSADLDDAEHLVNHARTVRVTDARPVTSKYQTAV